MKHKLRVCHVASGDLWAGAEVQVFNILAGLMSFKQIELYAIVMNSGRLYRELVSLGINVRLVDEKNVSIVCQLKKMRDFIKSNKIDIIHSHRYKENIFSSIIVLLLSNGCKLVKTQHGSFNIVATKRLWAYRAIDLLFTKYIFKKIITVSHDIENEYLEFMPSKKVQTIHNSVFTEKYTLPCNSSYMLKKKNHSIGIVGRLERIKNVEEFIKIAAELKKIFFNMHAYIVGDGSEKDHLISFVKQLKGEKYISFLGHIDDVSTFYNMIDILYVTSFHEGIPTVILEAMYFGKIVIAHDVGGISEIIEHKKNGFLYKNFDYIVQLSIDILNNKDTYSYISENARNDIDSKFKNTNQAKKYIHEYTQLLGFASKLEKYG